MRIKRFGLRTLLITTALIAAVVAWISSNMKLSQKEERIIKQLNFPHSQAVIIDSSTVQFCVSGCGCIASRTPPSLINQLGAYVSPRIFERVTEVELYGGRYDDNTLQIIGQLPYLKKLCLPRVQLYLHCLKKLCLLRVQL